MGGVIIGSGLLGLSLYDAFVAEMLDEGQYHQWSGRSNYNEEGGVSSIEQEAIFGSQVKWFIGLAIGLTFASLGFLCWESCMWHQSMDHNTRSPSPVASRVASAMRSKRDALGAWSGDGAVDLEGGNRGSSFPASGLRSAHAHPAATGPPSQAPGSVLGLL